MIRARLGSCLAAMMLALLVACVEGHAGPIDPHRSLLVTDAAVLGDPARTVDPCMGSARLPVWSFGYLMTELVAQRPDITPQEFVRQWLMLFGTPQSVNGQTVLRGTSRPCCSPGWIRSLADPVPAAGHRQPSRPASGAAAGRRERGRSALHLRRGRSRARVPPAPVHGHRRVRRPPEELPRGAGLGPAVGGPQRARACRSALPRGARIAYAPARHERSAIRKSNHSWLQLRTNEADLGTDGVWEMRQFRLDPRKGTLRQEPLTMTPRGDLNSTPALGLFLHSITGGLNRHDYRVPRNSPSGTPWRARSRGSPARHVLGPRTTATKPRATSSR